MRGRLLGLLIGLYPPRWRRRYGAEMRQLVTQLARSGQRSRSELGLGLIAGATREWWRQHGWQISGAVSAGAVTALLVLVLAGGGTPHDSRLTTQRMGTPARGLIIARAPRGKAFQVRPCPLNYDPEGTYNPQDGSGNSCGTPACSEPISTGPTAPQQVMPATGAGRARRQCASTYVPRSGKSVEIARSY